MKKRSKAETERFYREILAEPRESGLSVRAFGKARGIPAGTLSWLDRHLLAGDATAGREALAAAEEALRLDGDGVATPWRSWR